MTPQLVSLGCGALLILGAQALVPRTLPAQVSAPLGVTTDVRALAGCYRLTGRWLDAPRDYPGAVPLPPLVHLDTVPQRYRGRLPDFRASPALTSYHEFPSEPGWRPLGRDSLVVSWWDGYTGPTLVLRRAGAVWRGVATYSYHQDIAQPGPRIAAEAARAPCPSSSHGTSARQPAAQRTLHLTSDLRMARATTALY